MKQKIIVIICVMLVSHKIGFSQPGTKWDLGGNIPNFGSFLGSTNAQLLDFKTQGQNRLRILQAASPAMAQLQMVL